MNKIIAFGIDVGSERHHIAILTPENQLYKEIVVEHNQKGFKKALGEILMAKEKFNAEPLGGLEGHNGYGSPFDEYLMAHGVKLKQVNSFKLSRYRELYGQPFKKDKHDARLIANFVANYKALEIDERKCLHEIIYEEQTIQKIRLLTRYQERLIREQTRLKNRLQKHLREYFPEYFTIVKKKQLSNYNSLSLLRECPEIERLKNLNEEEIAGLRANDSKACVGSKLAKKVKKVVEDIEYFPKSMEVLCEVIKSEAKRLLELKREIRQLDKRIEEEGRNCEMFKIIKSYPGAGTRTAGRLAGEIISVERFRSSSALGVYLGVSGIDDSSGKIVRVRAVRKFNYRAKNAIMEIAFSSIRLNPLSKTYYVKKRCEGKSHWEAIKYLARQIVKVFYAMLKNHTLYDPNYRTSSLKKGKIKQVGRQSYQSPLKEVDKEMSHTLPPCILIFNGREIKWKI